MTVEFAPPAATSAPRDPADESKQLRPMVGSYGRFGGRLAVGVIGLGLLVVALGWYGASGEGARIDGATDIRAQLPYLLSGGFLGLSLVVLGSALLLVQASRLERARAEALLEARFDRLAQALGAQLRDPLPEGMVVAGTAAYHSPHCPLVDGRPGQDYVTVDVAEDMGLRPCRRCGG